MGIEKLNEYRICFEDNSSETFMAENARKAIEAVETDGRPVTQLTRLKVGIGVQTPVRSVKFNVTVAPETSTGCIATPETYIVPENTKVIFSAIPAEGFEFDGWFLKGEIIPLSTELVAEIPVAYPADPAALAAEFEARFSPV